MRILLADMTAMLASIIDVVLGGAPDLVVAGRSRAGDDLVAQIRLAHADVMMMSSPDPGNIDNLVALLGNCPSLRVLAIAADCSSGYVHELRPHSTRIANISAEVLVAAVRGQASPA